MRGFGPGARSAFTKADYGDFRLVVSSRMAPVNNDHLGVLFWGPRPAEGSVDLPHETVAAGSRDFESWNVTEILASVKTGTLRLAVDGREIVRYTDKDPARLSKGPIGMRKHGGGGSEYRDIFLEVDPTEDRLYTVK
jgi:hypothetical protein